MLLWTLIGACNPLLYARFASSGLPSTAQWQPELGVLQQRWPVADESKLQLDVVDLPLQINGKFRGSLQVECCIRGAASARSGFFFLHSWPRGGGGATHPPTRFASSPLSWASSA